MKHNNVSNYACCMKMALDMVDSVIFIAAFDLYEILNVFVYRSQSCPA